MQSENPVALGGDPPEPNKPWDCAADNDTGGGLYQVGPYDDFRHGSLTLGADPTPRRQTRVGAISITRAELRERVNFVLRLISSVGATLHHGRRGGRPGVAARYIPVLKSGTIAYLICG